MRSRPKNMIRLSEEGFCAAAAGCYPLNGDRSMRRHWLKSHRLYVGLCGIQPRCFSRVAVRCGNRLTAYLMDAITGTLYSPRTLRSPSSVAAINAVIRDQRGAEQLLLSR